MSSVLVPNPNRLKQGDTKPLVATLKDVNGAIDLTSCTALFRMKSKTTGVGHAPISAACEILQGLDGNGRIINKGKLRYVWAAGETDLPGVYGIEFTVTFPDGKKRTFPNDRLVTLEIEPSNA